MSTTSDTAIGAILTIPDKALTDIQKAEDKINELGRVSETVANDVSRHWGEIATQGLDAFIRKLEEASRKLGGLSTTSVNLNTQPLESKLEQAANTTQKETQNISKSIQDIASMTIDFQSIDSIQKSVEAGKYSIDELKAHLKKLEEGRNKRPLTDDDTQAQTNAIEKLKEYIALQKQSDEQREKQARKAADTDILEQQKNLLSQILQYQKDINRISQEHDRAKKLGASIPQDEIERVRRYNDEIEKLRKQYGELKTQTDKLSESGQRRFNKADIDYELAHARELTAAESKRAQILQLTKKLLSETKLRSAGVSSREEGVYLNEQAAVYQQIIRMIEKRGEVEARVAAQGYAQTSEQSNLLKTIQNEINRLEASLSSVTGTYTAIDAAAKKAFEHTKTLKEAENADKLAEAHIKAAEAIRRKNAAEAQTEKSALTKDKAEYKRILTLIEQMEKAQRKLNEALQSANLPANLAQQLQTSAAAAEATLDNLYKRRAELEAKRGQELLDIQNQHEAKKGQAALAEHEKAEKEKTRISKQEANERYNEEMRQRRLQNAQLTAAGKQQRMNINDAREQRAIELAAQRQKEIERLRQEIGKLNEKDADYQKNLDRLNQRINELLGSTQRRVEYTREEAMAMAKNAKTLREHEAAYRALKEAMANTDPKAQAKEWKEMNDQLRKTKNSIDEIKGKMGDFRNQVNRASNVMGQLQNRIAAAFSIAAIQGFIKKMVEVRAQFELQRVALGAIIQDRDEANKIFTQVQNMALESPFSIMQLERATKQIAAFGFEAKKLVPTMKMFADISAGLGVEIDRLVLVMGHLKARNFLEGTMVRQFTNMGFNILGELSKYYSEIENKLVSVGEVQDRVKKKMVSFEDVEEVLKRVTSAGGMFYDMQKKQSDSLWGQMQRIKDAYDLMLNEIGQSNEGSIKKALTLIRTLINHWRTVAPLIQAAGAAIAVFFTVSRWSAFVSGLKGVVGAFKNMTTVIWGAKAAQDALNASQKANAWGLIASLITAAVVAIWEFATAQSQLNEAMDRVRSEGIGNMYELIITYQKLADTVRDTNKPYEEQRKALDEIKRIYAEILPDELKEIENIKAMSEGYEEATKAIKAYSAEKIKTNLRAEIENIVGKDIQSEENNLADILVDKLKISSKIPENTLRSVVKTVFAEVSEEVKLGVLSVDDAFAEAQKRIEYRLKGLVSPRLLDNIFKNLNNSTSLDYVFKKAFGWGKNYEDKLKDYLEQIAGIDIGIDDAESPWLTKTKRIYEDLTNAVNEYKKAIEALRIAKEKGEVKGEVTQEEDGRFTAENDGQMGQVALDNLTQAYTNLQEKAKMWAVAWTATSEEVNAGIESQIGQMNYFEQVNTNVFAAALGGYKRWSTYLNDKNTIEAWVENANRAQDALDLSPIQNKIFSVGRTVTLANGMQIKSLDKLRIESLNSFGDAAKAAQSVYKQLKANELAIQTQMNTLIQYGYSAAHAKTLAEAEFGAGLNLEELRKMIELYKELIPAFGGTLEEKKTKGTDPMVKKWKDRIKALQEYYAAREKARKNLSTYETEPQQRLSFEQLWKDLGLDAKEMKGINLNDLIAQGFDPKSLQKDFVSALKKLKELIPPTYKDIRDELERVIAKEEIEVKFKIKAEERERLEKEITDMFDNYTLTRELANLGVNIDLTYMVGGTPTTLADIRREYERLMIDFANKSEEEQKIIQKMGDDLNKKEYENRKKQLQNYIKYLAESMVERAQIEIKAMQDISKIRMDETLDAFSKEQAIMQRRKKMQEDLAKMDMDELKSSDVYISVFKDLERASKDQLQYVLDKLKELQSTFKDLSPAQVKAIATEMAKIEEALADKESVTRLGANLRDAIKYARQRNALLRQQTTLQETINGKERALANAQVNLNELTLKRDAIWDKSSEEWEDANAEVQTQQQLVVELQDEIQKLREQITGVTENINKGEQAWKSFQSGLSKVHAAMNQIKDSFDSVFEGLDSMGLVNDAFRDTYESIGDILKGIDTFMTGLESMDITKPFSIITGAVKSIGGIFQSIGGVFGIGDKKKERQIQRLNDKVDALDKAYQKLEKSIEAAYTFDDYNAGYKQMQQNLDDQKAAYEEMISLEEDKKKSDKEKIKEYTEKLEEIEEAQQELRDSRIEAMGSTTDYLSEAQSFVEAWLDAYKETGSGLDALSESWEEFVESLFVRQGAAQIVSARLKNIIDRVNNAIDADKTDFDLADAVNSAREEWKQEAEKIEPILKELFGAYGLGKGNGEYILSDLQKGIQNITEPQAAAIEAYLNSMRFAVFRHTEQLDTLITTIRMQYDSNADNPVVSELKGIRSVLNSIDKRLDSVTKSSMGKTYIQVG